MIRNRTAPLQKPDRFIRTSAEDLCSLLPAKDKSLFKNASRVSRSPRKDINIDAYILYLSGVKAVAKFDIKGVDEICKKILELDPHFVGSRYSIGRVQYQIPAAHKDYFTVRNLECELNGSYRGDVPRLVGLFEEALRARN